ncbi:hypothetical protein CL653_02665 [bacterium]|nr:hypothetical protein [bacterium]
MESALLKILLPAISSFVVGILITPIVTHWLYKHKMWKKVAGKTAGYGDNNGTPIFNSLHKDKDVNTPRMGGIVVWVSVVVTLLLFWCFTLIWQSDFTTGLNFFSREQTLLPMFMFLVGAAVGFLDDLLTVKGRGGHFADGLSLRYRLTLVTVSLAMSGWWFYDKLEVSSINLIGYGPIELGLGFVLVYIFMGTCIYMSSVIDGLDGLSGGVFLFIFAAYAGISFYQGQYDISALCASIVGALLAFLWFNIPPARFYMGETGMMALTLLLTMVVFMTDVLGDGEGVLLLPVVGFLLVVTVGTTALQILSKKFRGKKIFLVAPLHHHFEAKGWPAYKVTMRYWILGFICAMTGLILAIAF